MPSPISISTSWNSGDERSSPREVNHSSAGLRHSALPRYSHLPQRSKTRVSSSYSAMNDSTSLSYTAVLYRSSTSSICLRSLMRLMESPPPLVAQQVTVRHRDNELSDLLGFHGPRGVERLERREVSQYVEHHRRVLG